MQFHKVRNNAAFVQLFMTFMACLIFQVPPTKVHMVGGVAGSMDDGTAKTNNVQAVLSEVSDVKSRQDNMTVKLENLKLYVGSFVLPSVPRGSWQL